MSKQMQNKGNNSDEQVKKWNLENKTWNIKIKLRKDTTKLKCNFKYEYEACHKKINLIHGRKLKIGKKT